MKYNLWVGLFLVFLLVITGCQINTPPSNDSFIRTSNSTLISNCNITTQGKVYIEQSTHLPCYCNSTNWVYISDNTLCLT
jgi:hypothetical protein